MKFKDADSETQFNVAPAKLKEICLYFEVLSNNFGHEPTVTRVCDPVAGDSGVHEAKRAVDFRDEVGGVRTYTDPQVEFIVNAINKNYPRNDGKLVCIHHSFHGAPEHFHIQIPLAWELEHTHV